MSATERRYNLTRICCAVGADALVNYTSMDLKEKVTQITGNNGADVVFELGE